jgi:serine phosphatase RsbU (regulator of sigma subunit)/DNA-binding response OmpR family regulator
MSTTQREERVAGQRGGAPRDRPPVVLVIDDSPENRFATRRALDGAGFEVWEEETGTEGMRRAANDPSVIVLDVNLPDVGGVEVCRRLKADPRTARVPILHLSGVEVDAAARVQGLNSGADAYMTHPVTASVLVATVRALLRLRRADDVLRRALQRSELLSDLHAAFSDALTPGEVFAVVADRCRRDLGAREVVHHLLDRDGVLRPAQAGEVGEVARSGRAAFDLPRGSAARRAVVPLMAYGRPLGALALTFDGEDDFGEDERTLLRTLGERAGQALERARLYDDQRRIATTLQGSLLPAQLPDIPGVELGCRYISGTKGVSVGGDFYDVFARRGSWIAVIGDVCGRGAQAAALTSLARHTVRAEAQHDDRPSAILTALDLAVKDDGAGLSTQFLTAVCVGLRPHAGGLTATIASGGHPAPIIVHRDGTTAQFDCPGSLIGVLDEVSFSESVTELRPGDALVLVTDGVIEARTGTDLFGEQRLRALLPPLARAGADAQAMADAIVDAAARHGGAGNDDVAVLTIRVVGDTTTAS